MKAQIFIDTDRIGEVELTIIDESMGVLGGQVIVLPNYQKYRLRVQQETNSKGGANSEDFPLRLINEKGFVLKAQGGVMLIDSPEFEELSVEVSGVNLSELQM